MIGPPSFTVAVPTMNGSAHLAETLASILRQEGVEFDLVVSDDRSEDGTAELAREVAGDRARVETNSERLGLAGNWNRCAGLARTPYIAIVHQDDVLRPGHLAAHWNAIRTDPRIGLVASASGVIDERGSVVSEKVIERGGLGPEDRTFSPGEALPKMAASNPLRCSAVSLRVETHRRLGGFDPNFRYVVDWEFWLRVARQWSVSWLSETTTDVRWHGGSETHRFRTGTADLEETERLLRGIIAELSAKGLGVDGIARDGVRRVSRAYLNRAHGALRVGNGAFGRDCLRRAVRLWPGVLGVIAGDPRLAVQMASVWAAPGLSAQWFGRHA